MKIAGRKNDGAWFRTNCALLGNPNKNQQPMTEGERTALINYLDTEMLYADAYYNDLVALQAEAGVTPPEGFPETKLAFLTGLINNGIPRQVWQGKLTFTTYTKQVDGGVTKYVPNYTANARNFANELRGFMKRHLFARRQIRDVFNIGTASTGNPGGRPDGRPDNE